MPPMVAKYTAPIESFLYVTELCANSLNNVPLGVGRVAGDQLWHMLAQVAAGCKYLHSKEIVHRDLKPGNILISEVKDNDGAILQQTYKVCDFGVSRWLGGEDGGGDRAMAMTGGIGTALYMAPEIITNDKAKMGRTPYACDVHSYGILAWQILSGDRPYITDEVCASMGLHQIKQQVVQGLRPEIPQSAEEQVEWGWPEGVAGLLQRCWAGVASERPQFNSLVLDLEQMQGAFDALAVEEEESEEDDGSDEEDESGVVLDDTAAY